MEVFTQLVVVTADFMSLASVYWLVILHTSLLTDNIFVFKK